VTTIIGTGTIIEQVGGAGMAGASFWVPFSCFLALGLGALGLVHSWSVALINPPSANRGLGMRLAMLAFWAATGVLFSVGEALSPLESFAALRTWLNCMACLCSLAMVIAINEREHWTPRVARTIPRRRWLRLPAFLLYSGGAGGVLFALVLFGLTCLVLAGLRALFLGNGTWKPGQRSDVWQWTDFSCSVLLILYTYDYALAAVFVRRHLYKVKAIYTWVVMVVLLAAGSGLPFLAAFLFLYPDWSFDTHYYWLVSIPFTAFYAASHGARYDYAMAFFYFAGCMAVLVTVLNVPWFAKQIHRFRPYRRAPVAAEPLPLKVSPAQMDVTKTAL